VALDQAKRCGWAGAFAAIVWIAPAYADAQPAEATATELLALEQEMDDALSSLATADCTTACRALESMLRSADKICELAPGPRCDAARRKVDTARERVLERCPDCAAAAVQQVGPAPPTPAEEPATPSPDVGYDEEKAAADGPPAEEATSGCAACAVGGRSISSNGAWLWLLGGLIAWRRRRAKG
jgi:hypothetical protein